MAVLVALGGAAGAGVRWIMVEVGPETAFPWAVLFVNLVGCTLLGALVGRGVHHGARLLVGTGFCGGLTTFSTLTVEVASMLRDDRAVVACTYLAVSVLAGLGCFDRARAAAAAVRSGAT